MSLAAAGNYLLVGAGDAVYCEGCEHGELYGSVVFPLFAHGRGLLHPGPPKIVAVGSSALLLSMWSLTRRSLPKLDGEERRVSGIRAFRLNPPR